MASAACFQSTSRALSVAAKACRGFSVSCRLTTSAKRRRLTSPAPNVGFLLDIDGVLMGGDVGDKGKCAIDTLREHRRPFVLMTNGGGASTGDRARLLTKQLDAEPALSTANVLQAHTSMLDDLKPFRDKRVYMVGAREGRWQRIAEELQLSKADNIDTVLAAHPDIWPFRDPPADLAAPSWQDEPFAAIVVVHDSRDYGADTQIMLDILTSKGGRLGTSQEKAEEQIPLFYSNGDLLWKNAFPLPRMGQGSFHTAFEAVFERVTGRKPVSKTFGKPTVAAYTRARAMLDEQNALLGNTPLTRVVMVGDNPESDIAGANNAGIESVLVETGVYKEGEPSYRPSTIQRDVLAAIEWAVKKP